jgi:hypothetical protein
VKDLIDNEVANAVKAKDTEIAALASELAPLKQKLAVGEVANMISKSDIVKDETKPLVEYLKKLVKVDGDVTAESVDKVIKEQLALIKSAGIKFSDKPAGDIEDKTGKDKDKRKPGDGDKSGIADDDKTVEDYTTPENNSLIPQYDKAS